MDMDNKLDWSGYSEQGMGDAYAGIPKRGGDFAKAVAVCISNGHCESANRGVMCPSFRISKDKTQSPGGRVRLIKAYLNRPQGTELSATDMAQLEETMDSCVSCKGCKRECESNLDMAQIKAEFLAQRLQHHSLPLRDRLFAQLPQLLYRFPILAGLIRQRNRSPTLANITDKVLGISAQIDLPELAAVPFAPTQQVYPPYQRLENTPLCSVLLWLDPFSCLFAPQQCEDALHVLRSAGYEVHLLHPQSTPGQLLDAGRTQFSKGLIEQARQQASQLLDALDEHVQADRPIIGLEPSALLMLRDEFLTLELGERAIETAKKALLFEEFLGKESKKRYFSLPLMPAHHAHPIQVHGHCHQKAVGAMKSMRRVLRLIPDLPFSIIESSCCGMAGTFGMESEHIDQAREMAQQGLLPTLDAHPDAQILSNGFACAYQINHLTKRKPIHLATLLAEHVVAQV